MNDFFGGKKKEEKKKNSHRRIILFEELVRPVFLVKQIMHLQKQGCFDLIEHEVYQDVPT